MYSSGPSTEARTPASFHRRFVSSQPPGVCNHSRARRQREDHEPAGRAIGHEHVARRSRRHHDQACDDGEPHRATGGRDGAEQAGEEGAVALEQQEAHRWHEAAKSAPP